MFSAGTRVNIYVSSAVGKKLAPKKHSVGYVSNSPMSFHLPGGVPNYPVKNQSFMITPLHIVFTRYGKEERRRREKRMFLQITPTFPKMTCTVAEVDSMLKRFRRGELHKNTGWKTILGEYGAPGAEMGVALPVGAVSACNMDKAESLAWVKSVLTNPTFQSLSVKSRTLPTLNSVISNTDVLIWISNASRKSSARKGLFEWATDTKESMEQLVSTVAVMKAVFDKTVYENSLKQMVGSIERGSTAGYDSMTAWYADRMFDSDCITDKRRAALKPVEQNLHTSIINFMNNLEVIRRTYLTHKTKQV